MVLLQRRKVQRVQEVQKMFNWLRYRWEQFIYNQFNKYYTVGGHCGLCGKWIPDAIVDKYWTWTLCDDAGDEGACYLQSSNRRANEK